MSNTPLDIERRERRIHIDIGELTAGTAYYERISGRAFAADIGIEENLVEQVGVGDMLSLLMSALGFIEPPGGLGSRPERPTAGRVEVICQIYGNPTLCDASFRAP